MGLPDRMGQSEFNVTVTLLPAGALRGGDGHIKESPGGMPGLLCLIH